MLSAMTGMAERLDIERPVYDIRVVQFNDSFFVGDTAFDTDVGQYLPTLPQDVDMPTSKTV